MSEKVRRLFLILAGVALLTGVGLWIDLRREEGAFPGGSILVPRRVGVTDGALPADPAGPAELESGDPGATPSPDPPMVDIYLVGAVRNPGIYRIPAGTLLHVLLELAGGLTEEADPEDINLVYRVESGGMLKVHGKEDPKNPGGPGISSGTGLTLSGGSDGKGPLDLNAASVAELETLPGIGTVTATAIVAYRERNGPFRKTEDLMKVPGIKQSRYDALRDLVRVG